MAYLDTYNLRYDSTNLRKKTSVSIANAAVDILNEDPGTSLHSLRLQWANDGLSDTETMTERMMWGVITDSTVAIQGDAASDSQVQDALNSVVNIYAKMYL